MSINAVIRGGVLPVAQSTGAAQLLVPQHLRVELNFQAEEFGEVEQPPS